MPRSLLFLSALTISLAVGEIASAQSSLSQVRESVWKEHNAAQDESPSDKKSRHRAPEDSWCDDDDDDSAWAEILGRAFLYTVSLPYAFPYAVLEHEDPWSVEFSRFPYDDGHDGYLIIDPESGLDREDWLGARVYSEYGSDFAGLSRIGGRALFETTFRLGIDTEWNHWSERTPAGRDELWTGDVNLILRFAQSETIQFRSGLGVNWLSDQLGGEAGFNFTYGVDVFPGDPFVLESTIDWGRIGDAGLFHVRGTAGVIWKGLEIYTGYDYLKIGDADLHGLIGGLALWF